MRILIRVLIGAWVLISVGLGLLAFAVVNGTSGGAAIAAREAFETIPEAIMQIMGFEGVPLPVVVAYWLALAAAVFLALKPRQSI